MKRLSYYIKIAIFFLLQFAVIGLMCCTQTHAGTLKADYPIGGASYLMSKYVECGGDLSDCLPDAYKVSDEEREVLYRIVEAEVTGEGNSDYYQAKRNVASCIIVRWQDGWAKTITDVVFQKCGNAYQFSPIKDKRYWSVVVTQQTRKAVDNIIRYGVCHDSTYFCTRTCESYKTGFHSTLNHTFDDVEHSYFKEK